MVAQGKPKPLLPGSHVDVTYFAYGSNLCLPRLESRVPGVRALGTASLLGYELRWHKRGADQSGKCSIVPSGSVAAVVHGALFTIPKAEKHLLDRVESLGNGYGEITVWVESSRGSASAQTYVAAPTHIDDSLRPYTWYKDLVVSGAESHDLPVDYVESLRLVAAWPDQDASRARRNRASLPCGGSARPS